MARQFNAPPSTASTVGPQLVNEFFQKKALIEAAKEQYFGQLADTVSMPKNMGKKIKRYHYLPMLDDANINDQGIDAAGVAINSLNYEIRFTRLTGLKVTNANAASSKAAIDDNVGATTVATIGAADSAGAGFATVTLVGSLVAVYSTSVKAAAVTSRVIGTEATQRSGNLYGSSKDIGTISGKLPARPRSIRVGASCARTAARWRRPTCRRRGSSRPCGR